MVARSPDPNLGRVLALHLQLQALERSVDSFLEFLDVQAANWMFDDDQVRIKFPRLGLRRYQQPKRFCGDDNTSQTVLPKFDTVMETPRRAGASVTEGKKPDPVLACQLIDHRGGCWLAGAAFGDVVDVVYSPYRS